MRLLGLDTAVAGCSVALWENGAVLRRQAADMARGQAEALMPMVDHVLSGEALSSVEAIAVTVGPGSFTGLRIGLAAARGMALAAGRPCLGVTTLEAVAHAVDAGEPAGRALLVALETRRADVYAQTFSPDLEPLAPPAAVPPDDLAAWAGADRVLVAGDAAERAVASLTDAGVDAHVSTAPGRPDAAVVAAIAAGRWQPGAPIAPPPPLYLRPPAVTLPRPSAAARR